MEHGADDDDVLFVKPSTLSFNSFKISYIWIFIVAFDRFVGDGVNDAWFIVDVKAFDVMLTE